MYIVTEIQTNADGSVGTLITSFANQNDAESKYHDILRAAAVSNLPKHAAIMFTEEGFPMLHQCYTHVVAPEPVVEAVVEADAEPEAAGDGE